MSQEKFEALRQNLSHKRRRRKNKVFYANAKGRAYITEIQKIKQIILGQP